MGELSGSIHLQQSFDSFRSKLQFLQFLPSGIISLIKGKDLSDFIQHIQRIIPDIKLGF